MKRTIFALLTLSTLIFSCSSDKEDQGPQGQEAIVGTWQATELKIDNETASDEAKFGRDILNHLTAKDCYILSLTFNADLSVILESSANYLEINVNETNTGIDIPCPTEVDTEMSTYEFDGKVITYVDTDSTSKMISATIEGTIMRVDAADLDIPNFNASGELLFVRK